MTEAGLPRSMAIWKASRSLSRSAASSIRASATIRPVSCALSAKCLIVEAIPFDWMPAICAPASRPASSGSSPRYSKLRPPHGSRVRLTPPASITLKRLARASAPIIAPPACRISGSKLAALARPEGSAVATSPLRCSTWLATPSDASVSRTSGTPRRGMPSIWPAEGISSLGVLPSAIGGNSPWTRAIFSSSDIRATMESARVRASEPGSCAAACAAGRVAAVGCVAAMTQVAAQIAFHPIKALIVPLPSGALRGRSRFSRTADCSFDPMA